MVDNFDNDYREEVERGVNPVGFMRYICAELGVGSNSSSLVEIYIFLVRRIIWKIFFQSTALRAISSSYVWVVYKIIQFSHYFA